MLGEFMTLTATPTISPEIIGKTIMLDWLYGGLIAAVIIVGIVILYFVIKRK
jgi:hypothetical protein